MEAKFTPGPWRQRLFEGRYRQTAIETEEGASIAHAVWTKDGTWQANVTRIVQCVNAHDELVSALRDIEMETRDGGQGSRAEINDIARAAIAKATGEAA